MVRSHIGNVVCRKALCVRVASSPPKKHFFGSAFFNEIECYETEYWPELFLKSEIIEREKAKDLYNQCGTIRRLLMASINTSKENK